MHIWMSNFSILGLYFCIPLKFSGIIRFIRNIYAANPHSVYKQPNPNIHNFYLVYKKRNNSFPYNIGFVRIIWIRYTPNSRQTNIQTTKKEVRNYFYSSFLLGWGGKYWENTATEVSIFGLALGVPSLILHPCFTIRFIFFFCQGYQANK